MNWIPLDLQSDGLGAPAAALRLGTTDSFVLSTHRIAVSNRFALVPVLDAILPFLELAPTFGLRQSLSQIGLEGPGQYEKGSVRVVRCIEYRQ